MKKNRVYSILAGVFLGALPAFAAFSSISISSSHDSSFSSDNTAQFTWQAPDTNDSWVVDEYRYKVDSSTDYSVTINDGSTATTSHTTNALSDGTYYFHVAPYGRTDTNATVLGATDTYGPIKIDTTAPTLGTLSTSDGLYGQKTVTLSASDASDPTGTKIYYTTDGTDVNATNGTAYNATPFTLYSSKTVKFRAKDGAGNWSTQSTQDVTVTYTGNVPVISGVSASATVATNDEGGATSPTENLTVGGNDVQNYQYKVDGGSWSTKTPKATPITISGLSDGEHTISVIGYDSSDRKLSEDDAQTVTFTVDNTAPTNLKILVNGVEANASNPSTVTFGANFTFTLSSSDGTIKYSTTAASDPTNVYSGGVTTTKTVATGNVLSFPIKMIATDSAGNVADEVSVEFTIDKDKPELAMPSPAPFSSTLDVDITTDDNSSTIYYLVSSSASATVSGIKTNGEIGSGSGVTATIGQNPTNDQEDSTYKYLHAIAVDIAGNGDDSSDQIKSVTFTYNASTRTLSATSSVDIGSVTTNSSTTKSITITNSGSESITLADANITVSGSDFNKTSTTCATTIPSEGTCVVVVGFTPSTTGSLNGTLSIKYDGTTSDELNISLSGTGLNAAPVATYASVITLDEDTSTKATLTATDAENDTLSFYKGSSEFNGTIVLETNGTVTVTPTANYNGAGWFTYYAFDGEYNSSEQNITITVNPINDLPVITLSAQTIEANGGDGNQGYITFSFTDIDGDDVNGTVISNPTKGTATVNNSENNISFDGNDSTSGDDSFVVTFSDGNGGDVNKTIYVTIANFKPVASADDLNISEDNTSASGSINVYDVDGDDILASIETNASHGSVTLQDTNITSDENVTTYTYVPETNFNGSDSFVVRFDDGQGGIVDHTVYINVTAVNDAPNIDFTSLDNLSVDEDNGTTSYDLNVSDIEMNELNITVTSSNTSIATVSTSWDGILDQGYYVDQTLDFNITTVPDAFGAAKITILVQDGEANTTMVYDFNVSAVNDAPILETVTNRTKSEDFADFNITLSATDVDDENLTYGATSNNLNVSVEVTNNILTISSSENYNGSVVIDINVTDGEYSDENNFTLTINPVNDAPVATTTESNITESSLSGVLTSSDIEGDDVTYSLVDDASIGSVSVETNGTFTYTPGVNYAEDYNDSFTYKTSDGSLDSATQSVTLNITSVDDAPEFNATTITPIRLSVADANNTIFYKQISAFEPDVDQNQTITYSVVSITKDGSDTETIDANFSSATDGNLTITITTLDTNDSGAYLVKINALANGLDANTSFYLTIKDDNVSIDDTLTQSSVISGDGTQETTLSGGGIDKGVTIKQITNTDGSVDYSYETTNSTTINLDIATAGVDSFVDANGTTKASATDGNITRTLQVTQEGNISGELKNENNVTTKISISVPNATIIPKMADDGSIETNTTVGGKTIIIKTENTGVVKPTKVSNTPTPKQLPAGSDVKLFNDGSNNKVQYGVTLSGDTKTIELN